MVSGICPSVTRVLLWPVQHRDKACVVEVLTASADLQGFVDLRFLRRDCLRRYAG